MGGRSAFFGVAGEGVPVVFLHGWALAQHAYKRPLKRLVQLGARVWAPALPGFGGSEALAPAEMTLEGYGRWLIDFLDAAAIDEPVVLIGHSFGGAVAIQAAHDARRRVRQLVLVNSIGSPVWSAGPGVVRTMAERPLVDWAWHFQRDVVPLVARIYRVVLEDAVPNLVRSPRVLWRAANLVRQADLSAELRNLRRRRLPVTLLWSEQDTVLGADCLEATRAALGVEAQVHPGGHAWLLADPDALGEAVAPVIAAAARERRSERRAQRLGHRRTAALPAPGLPAEQLLPEEPAGAAS